MTLAVTVLGSSGMFATVDRACAGYLVEIDSTRLWLDAGPGTWRNLQRHIPYSAIDGILLTHRHPDHISDLFIADHAWQYGGAEPLPRIPLWAPAQTMERIKGFVDEIDESFELRTVTAGASIDIAGAKFSFTTMAHPPETIGVRIERDNAVIAYSADTGPDADFFALASNADLFICEANLQDADEPWEGHLQASQAATIARDVGVKQLLLTHLRPGRDPELSLKEAKSAWPDSHIVLADDGARIEVSA